MTGYWRHAGADEPTRDKTQTNTPVSHATVDSSDTSMAAVEAAKRADQVESAQPANPLDSIPIPDAMPEIPSLADPESLKDDPGFQEFRRLFAKEEESWDSEPPRLRKEQSGPQSAAYFEALDKRLETAGKICSAARNIASEAARQARAGSREQSEELIRMATQLRDIAAKLLVSEM